MTGASQGLRFVAFCLAAASFAAPGCSDKNAPEPAPPIPVRVQTAASQQATGGLHYSASIQPYLEVELDFEVEGTVRSIRRLPSVDAEQGVTREIQAGDPIEAGEELARIDDGSYVDKLEEAKARLARAEAAQRKSKAAFERASHLKASDSITAPDFDRARKDFEADEADVAGAKAQLDQARIKLTKCVLTAPGSGVLLERTIEVGSYVRPGSGAFQVGDLSSVKAVFGVPDTAIPDLAVGSPVSFRTASAGERLFQGPITALAPAADERTRVFDVEVTVDNRDGALRPGMIASLVLPGAARAAADGLAVPMSAIVRSPRDPNGYAVAIIEDGQNGEATGSVARLQDVELGEPVGDAVQVTRGLRAGQRVIVTGAQRVTDGAAVRVVP